MTDRPLKESWGAAKAVLYSLGVFFLAQMVAVYTVGAIAGLFGHKDITKLMDESSIGQFFYYLVAESLVIALIWQVVKRYKDPLKQLGFARAPQGKDFGIAIAGYILYFIAFITIVHVVTTFVPGVDIDQKQEVGFATARGLDLVFVFASLVILPPITEEILFRGFVLRGLRKSLPVVPAAIITSILFGAAHLQFGSDKPLLWIAAMDTFALSMVLVWMRVKTQNLWAPITLHMLKNTVAFVLLFIAPLLGMR